MRTLILGCILAFVVVVVRTPPWHGSALALQIVPKDVVALPDQDWSVTVPKFGSKGNTGELAPDGKSFVRSKPGYFGQRLDLKISIASNKSDKKRSTKKFRALQAKLTKGKDDKESGTQNGFQFFSFETGNAHKSNSRMRHYHGLCIHGDFVIKVHCRVLVNNDSRDEERIDLIQLTEGFQPDWRRSKAFGEHFVSHGKYAVASKHYSRVVENIASANTNTRGHLRSQLVMCYLRSDQMEQAKSALDRAFLAKSEWRRESPYVYYQQACHFAATGARDEALIALVKVHSLAKKIDSKLRPPDPSKEPLLKKLKETSEFKAVLKDFKKVIRKRKREGLQGPT